MTKCRRYAQRLKHLPAMWETWVRSLGWEDPLEKEMATHSSILAWTIPWKPTPVFLPGESHGWRSLVGYSPRGRKDSDTTEWLHFHKMYGNLILCSFYFISNSCNGILTRVLEGGVGQGEREGRESLRIHSTWEKEIWRIILHRWPVLGQLWRPLCSNAHEITHNNRQPNHSAFVCNFHGSPCKELLYFTLTERQKRLVVI